MAKVNCLLRNLFIFFNVLFAIAGVCVLVLAVLIHLHVNTAEFDLDKTNGVIGLYMIGAVTFLVSFLGAHGALKNVKWMLVVFIVLMCSCCFALLRVAVPLAVLHPQVSLMQEEMQSVGPLDETSENFQGIMDEFQSQLHCCGLVNGYMDWRDQVPDSCDCSSDELMQNTCVPLPDYTVKGYDFFLQLESRRNSRRMVRKMPCGEIIENKAVDVILGLFFGFSTLAFLGFVMACCLLGQTYKTPEAVVKPSNIFSISSQPPKYTKLVDDELHLQWL
ncbi:tetraspanin-8-like [Alosa sapidissima]|uniref:tetraspanin-8-like n=1 Tax=Alosa sapidissima TaxID=34773 RepID=UPI001C08D94A|nr:tetraspanin-8-like [Alosa sapidissima]